MTATAQPVQFTLVRVWTALRQQGCEACGHAINARYVLRDVHSGRFLTVGSECAVSLCGQGARTMKQRRDRAARQWLKKLPAPRPSETRDQYIDRRVGEMANAMTAYRAWTMFFKGSGWTHHLIRLNTRAEKLYRLKRQFPNDPIRGWEYFQPARVIDHWQRVFGQRYSANPLDFCRAPWEVTKI